MKMALKKLLQVLRDNLSDDLRRKPWKGSRNRFSGHCYVACEALYHLTEGKLRPYFIRHNNEPHWFLKDSNGKVIDPTKDQFKDTVDYSKGIAKGFLTKAPSKRAQILIWRIRRIVG